MKGPVNFEFRNSKCHDATCKLFRLEVQTGGRNDWLGIEMRCAGCAAAKVQNFSSRATVATNPRVRSKSVARNRPDSMATLCDVARRWPVTVNNCAKSRKSNESISYSKGSFETISSAPPG